MPSDIVSLRHLSQKGFQAEEDIRKLTSIVIYLLYSNTLTSNAGLDSVYLISLTCGSKAEAILV